MQTDNMMKENVRQKSVPVLRKENKGSDHGHRDTERVRENVCSYYYVLLTSAPILTEAKLLQQVEQRTVLFLGDYRLRPMNKLQNQYESLERTSKVMHCTNVINILTTNRRRESFHIICTSLHNNGLCTSMYERERSPYRDSSL